MYVCSRSGGQIAADWFSVEWNIIDAEEALKCARVEEDYQIERHGFVEGGHDITFPICEH